MRYHRHALALFAVSALGCGGASPLYADDDVQVYAAYGSHPSGVVRIVDFDRFPSRIPPPPNEFVRRDWWQRDALDVAASNVEVHFGKGPERPRDLVAFMSIRVDRGDTRAALWRLKVIAARKGGDALLDVDVRDGAVSGWAVRYR
jgi:hypothetical protein